MRLPSQSSHRKTRSVPPRQRRLHLETLEDRRPLAVFAVTNTCSGAGSLGAAIAAANVVAHVGGVTDEIHFNIPATVPVLDYYRDYGYAGSIYNTTVSVTHAVR